MVEQAVQSPGRTLDASVRDVMEPRFGVDFSQVRIHADAPAAAAARSIDAHAFASGSHVVFGASRYQPQTGEGQRLIAHELAHVVQQRGAPTAGTPMTVTDDGDREASSASDATAGHFVAPAAIRSAQFRGRVVQRVPAPPTYAGATGVFDRGKVAIDSLTEVVASVGGGHVTLTPATVTATVTITEPAVTHLSWELYDPTDKFINGMSTTQARPNATSTPYVFDGNTFGATAVEGRHTLRCVGRNNGKPIVYSDRTLFVWTRTPLSLQSQPSLQAVSANPAANTMGDVGAAKARLMMLEHQAAVAATGTGLYEGNKVTGSAPSGVTREDCTTYVLEVLKHAFTAKGRASDWNKVYAEAQRTSAGAFKGTELMKALESQAGWRGVFWAPDPRNPADKKSEHPVAYKKTKEKGEYYGVGVDAAKSVVDYRPTSGTKAESMTQLDQLRKVPLGVIAARGGTHMTLILNGTVYEVHWDLPATDPNVIQATPLEKWEWQSGAVVMPPESFTAAFGP